MQAVLPAGAKLRLRQGGIQRLVVFASREHHCLADLLVRRSYAEFGAEMAAVVSNPPNLSQLAGKFGVPFHCVAHERLRPMRRRWPK